MRQGRHVHIIAHRGFSAVAPENTLASFEAAIRAGADAIELDVTLSADGVPVVIHDETVDRTTSGKGLVRAQQWSALSKLDAGSWFDARFSSERLPRLNDVLDLVDGRAEINVEIKGGFGFPAGLAHSVIATLRAHRAGAPGHIIISSFDPRILWLIRHRLAPDYRLGLLYEVGAPPERWWRAWRHAIGCDYLHPDIGMVGATSRVTEAPEHLNVWTVNERADMVRLTNAGVRGLITNEVALALEVVKEQNG